MCKKFLTKDYLTCNHGKCCEFRIVCPCMVRNVQNLRHSLYVSWSSLDGLLVCLLWCGFSEFRVIRGGCRRTARNLQDLRSLVRSQVPVPNYANNFYRVSLFLRCSVAACICCPKCALLFWGIFVRGLRVETFVRVLRSSELSLNNCK